MGGTSMSDGPTDLFHALERAALRKNLDEMSALAIRNATANNGVEDRVRWIEAVVKIEQLRGQLLGLGS